MLLVSCRSVDGELPVCCSCGDSALALGFPIRYCLLSKIVTHQLQSHMEFCATLNFCATPSTLDFTFAILPTNFPGFQDFLTLILSLSYAIMPFAVFVHFFVVLFKYLPSPLSFHLWGLDNNISGCSADW